MTKEEKQIIYNLLKKVDTNITIYVSNAFMTPPSFEDDNAFKGSVLAKNEVAKVEIQNKAKP